MPSVQQVHITPEIILTMLIDQVTFSNVVSSSAEIGWSCCAPVYCPDDNFTVSPHVVVHCYRRLPSGVTMRAQTSSCPCGALNIKLSCNCARIITVWYWIIRTMTYDVGFGMNCSINYNFMMEFALFSDLMLIALICKIHINKQEVIQNEKKKTKMCILHISGGFYNLCGYLTWCPLFVENFLVDIYARTL